MGVVWLAEETGSVRREVALKVIRPGLELLDAQSVARFEAERQALALMDHPNIAKVLGSGTTEGGLPYFAMELVRGLPITEFCDKHRLAPRERLALFAQVCQGVAHAHQKGIIHRDLKPSNVMVAHYDDRPVPKIIDFGVAKAMGPRLTERTLHTEYGQLLGTLPYMSPEQAELDQNELNIDTRSDIYSLGVLLYELLTGTRPFEPTAKTPLTDFLQEIRRKEPQKPSTRLSTSVDRVSTVEHQGIEPKRLSGMVRGDLDWIVMKALEKERERRYETAHAFAEDIQRYLGSRPVLAGPPTAGYRLRKFIRRRPAVAGMIALGFASLLLVAGLAWWHAVSVEAKNREIARERDAARAARDEEKRQRELAEQLAREILERKRAGDRLIYAADIDKAQRAWRRFQRNLTLRLLDGMRPEATDGVDYRGWEWRYLKRLCHSEEVLLDAHGSYVTCIAYSPDGTLLASGSRDGTAHLSDAKSGRSIHVFRGHRGGVRCVAFSPDGTMLATGSDDADIRLWDVRTGTPSGILGGHVLAVNDVAFDPSGRWLATAGADDTVQIHDVLGRKQLRVLPGHGGEVSCVTFAPDGKRLASAGTDHREPTVRVLDFETGAEIRTFEGNTTYLFFMPDGRRLVFGGINDLRIADVGTGEIVRSFAPSVQPYLPGAAVADSHHILPDGVAETALVRPSRGFGAADLSPDGKRILTVDGGAVQVLDADTGESLRFEARGDLVAWSPDGVHVAASGDRRVRIWSIASDPAGMVLTRHKGRVAALAFSPDGKQFASGSADQSIRIWDAATGEEVVQLGEHRYDYAPASPGEPPTLTGISTIRGHEREITRVAYSPDGRWLASASQDGTLRVWETGSGREALVLEFGSIVVSSLAWAPDGKALAAGAWDDDIHLFEFPGGKLVRKLTGHEENVSAVTFMEGGRLLASAGWDETIRIFEVETGREVRKLSGERLHDLTSLAVSPDGRLMAAAGGDMAITLWDTSTWEARTLSGHTSSIDDLKFSPDGRRLVSASRKRQDGTVKLWDVVTGLELLSLPGTCACAFSPDGARLAVGMRPFDIRIYETAPVDDQPYRTGRAEAPAPEENAPDDDGKLRALGFWTAPALRGNHGAPRTVRSSKEGREFLVAVVSIPKGRLIPSQDDYARMAAKAAQPGGEPLAKRECICLYGPRRFHLLAEGRDALKGAVVSVWPPLPDPGFALSPYLESTSRIAVQERMALAVAWPVDPGDVRWPVRVAFEEDEPIPLPDVRLEADPRLLPTAPDLVNERVDRALKAVRTDRYAEAAVEAAAAARDKDADSVTIYNAACVHALAAAKAREDPAAPAAERDGRAERLAASAVELLGLAASKGFRDVAHMKVDTDLDGLRARDDFAKLLRDLEAPSGG